MNARAWAVGVVLAASFSAHADYVDVFRTRDGVGPQKVPYLGRSQVLLIPVEVAGFPDLDMPTLRGYFSTTNATGFTTYYRTASLGRFEPVVTIAPTVKFDTCPLPAAQFPGCAVKRGDVASLVQGMEMMRQIVRRADAAGTDFGQFDANGRSGTPDGFIDGLMILTNTPFGGIAFPFGYFNTDDNLAGGKGGPMVVDGVKISMLGIGGNGSFRVLTHEFGHLLGMTDLYDELDQWDGVYFSPMGAWHYDVKPPLPDAEMRLRLRWSTWHQVSGKQTVTIQPSEKSGEIYRMGVGDEYFLVENRGPGGVFDKDFTARGLIVYHVDRTKLGPSTEGQFVQRLIDCMSCNPWHPFIRILEADKKTDMQEGGKPDYAADLWRDGDTLGPDPTGTPFSFHHRTISTNWYSGEASGFSMQDIKVNGDGTITVTFDGPKTGQCDDSICETTELGCGPSTCGAPPVAKTGCAASEGLWPALALLWFARRRAL